MTINEELSPQLLKLCRLSTREEEALLKSKLDEYGSLLPEQVGIGQFFSCNHSSKLVGILKEVEN